MQSEEMIISIILTDLEVHYHVGVPDAERAFPQRLLITLEMEVDAREAVCRDSLESTVDYQRVAQRILAFGQGRSWKLLETLARDLTTMVFEEFPVRRITIEIKKFVIPEARYVSVCLRSAASRPPRTSS